MDRCDQPCVRTLFESAPGLAGETEDHWVRISELQNRTAGRGALALRQINVSEFDVHEEGTGVEGH